MSKEVKAGRGKYTATPVSVTFPATFPNEKLAGKTMTYAGRGRKPTWWELAQQAGLIAADEAEVGDSPAVAPEAAPATDAKA